MFDWEDRGHDYTVTWNEVKELTEKELARRGKAGSDKIPMGVINFAMKKVWDEMYERMKKEYGDN